MKRETCGRTTQFKSICSTLGSYVMLGLYLLAAMLTLEYLWTGTLSGISIYLAVTSLFVVVLALLKCTHGTNHNGNTILPSDRAK